MAKANIRSGTAAGIEAESESLLVSYFWLLIRWRVPGLTVIGDAVSFVLRSAISDQKYETGLTNLMAWSGKPGGPGVLTSNRTTASEGPAAQGILDLDFRWCIQASVARTALSRSPESKSRPRVSESKNGIKILSIGTSVGGGSVIFKHRKLNQSKNV